MKRVDSHHLAEILTSEFLSVMGSDPPRTGLGNHLRIKYYIFWSCVGVELGREPGWSSVGQGAPRRIIEIFGDLFTSVKLDLLTRQRKKKSLKNVENSNINRETERILTANC